MLLPSENTCKPSLVNIYTPEKRTMDKTYLPNLKSPKDMGKGLMEIRISFPGLHFRKM